MKKISSRLFSIVFYISILLVFSIAEGVKHKSILYFFIPIILIPLFTILVSLIYSVLERVFVKSDTVDPIDGVITAFLKAYKIHPEQTIKILSTLQIEILNKTKAPYLSVFDNTSYSIVTESLELKSRLQDTVTKFKEDAKNDSTLL